MSKQRKSLTEEINEAVNAAAQSPQQTSPDPFKAVSATPILVTSKSQVAKANAGATIDYNSTLFAQNDESKALIEMEKAKIEQEKKYIPQEGTILAAHKELLQDEKKYKEFIDKGEELNKLREKSLWNRTLNTVMQVGMINNPAYGAANVISNILFDDEERALALQSPSVFGEGRSTEEEKKYNNLKETRERELRPAVILEKAKLREEDAKRVEASAELLKRRDELYAITGDNKADPNAKMGELPSFQDLYNFVTTGKETLGGKDILNTPEKIETNKINNELYLLSLAKKQNENSLKKFNDFLTGKNGLWDGLLNSKRDISSLGVTQMVTNQHVAKVAEKLDKLVETHKDTQLAWDNLTAGERAVMEAYNRNQETDGLELQKDNWWYHNANGVGQSLVFMSGMLLTGGANTLVKGAVEQGMKGLTKKVISNSIKGGLKRKLGVAITENFVPKATALVAQATISPMTYAGAARKYTGNTQLITDPDGKQKIVVRKGAYLQFMKEYEDNKSQLDEMYTELIQKENKTPEEESQLADIVDKYKNLETEKDMLLNQAEISKEKAFAYGLTETMKETGSELYVGQGGEYAAKLFGKSQFGKWLVGSKAGNLAKWMGEKTTAGGNIVANTTLGKLSSKAMYHTGANRLYHGIWGEMAEEVAVQLTPTLTENYGQQLKELINPSFYADVTAQTLMMSGGFASLGLANQVKNYKKHKSLYDSRNAIRESYKRMDKAVTDEDLAETIVMQSAGTGFSMADYNLKINKLRKEGKTTEANKLEEKKFYNMALKAIQTNTLDEFEKSLEKAQKGVESQETAANLGVAMRDIAEIKKVYEKYQGKANLGNIIELASQKITNKKSIQHLTEEMANQKQFAELEVESLILRNRLNVDYVSIEELLDREITDDEAGKQTQKLLDTIEKENGPGVSAYLDLLFAKENLQYAQHETMKAFNEQVSPTYQNKSEQIKAIDRQVRNNVKFAEENGVGTDPNTGKLNITDTFIEDTFNNIDTMGLSKGEVNEIKMQYKQQIKAQNSKSNVDSIENILKLYEEAEAKKQEGYVDPTLELEQTKAKNPIVEVPEVKSELTPNKPTDVQTINVKTEEFGLESPDSVPAQITQTAMDTIEKATSVSATETPLFTEEELGGTITNPNTDFSLAPPVFTEPQLTAIAGGIKKMYEDISKEIGRVPTFKEMLSHFVKYQGKEKAQNFFDAYKMGWEKNNYASTNYQSVYNDVFEPLKNTVDEMTALLEGIYGVVPVVEEISPEKLIADTKVLEAKKEEKESVVVTFTEENIPVKSLHGNRVDSPDLRLGFNAIEYEEVLQPDGTYKRISVLTNSLNDKDSVIDFKDLLNPDLHGPGSTLGVGVAPRDMWETIRIAVGRDANNEVITKTFAEIVAEKEALNPDFQNTQEFRDTVPMFAYDKAGKLLAHIHEVSWYNQWNVSDPSKMGTIDPRSMSKAHAQAIQDAKETASTLRNHILSGKVSKIKITAKTEGPFYSIENRVDAEGKAVPLFTVNEANPQAVIAVQVGAGQLEVAPKVPFNNESRKLINETEISTNGKGGFAWNIRRIGTDPVDGKQTWRAFQVVRYASQEHLETIKWAWSAYSLFDDAETDQGGKKVKVIQDVRKHIPAEYQLTKEEATAMIKEIKRLTGYNLMRFDEANNFFKLFLQPRSGDSNAEFGRSVYGKEIDKFAQHTNLKALKDNRNVITIANGKVTETGQNYESAIKDELQTGVKSFNVGTADEPVYVTSIQPSITFEYELAEEDKKTQETVLLNVEEAKMAALEAMQEVTGELSASVLVDKAKSLVLELGFNLNNLSFAPSTLQGTEALESIFAVTPGLDIKQESQLVNYIYNFILASIDIKYKSKGSTNEILKDLKQSYQDVVLPSKTKVADLRTKLRTLPASEEVNNAIENLSKVLSTLDNVETYWNSASIKENFDAIGQEYKGEKGIVEKALEEVYKTSDIKEAKLTAEEIAAELETEDDTSQREKNFSENSNLTEDGKGKITYRLRRFMSGIKKLDVEGNEVKGFLGLSDYMNFNEVYDNIYQLLGDGVYIQSDYNIMREKIMEMKESKPWVKELMERFDNADIQLRKEFVYNYRKHAVNMKFAMYSTGTSGATLQVFDTNANEITRIIAKEWKNNIKTTPLSKIVDGQYTIDRDKARELLDEYESWGTEGHLQPDSVVKAWIRSFGIDISDEYFAELKEDGFKSKGKVIAYPLIFKENTPIGLLGKYLGRMMTEPNLRYEENDKAHPMKDMNDVIKAMTKGESKYTAKMISKSFRDAGKNISGITQPTYLTDKIGDLKRAALSGDKDGFLDKLGKISMTHKSVMLELFKNDPDFASKVEADYLGLTALKELGGKSNNFSSITDLNSLDHDITKLTMFQNTQQGTVSHKISGVPMRIARMFLPTMSDKSQMLTISTGVFDFMAASDVFELDEKGNTKFNEDLREIIFERLILPEMTRISKFHEKKGTNVNDYNESAQVFNFFPALNNVKDKNGDRIIKHLGMISLDKVIELHKEQLTDTLEQILHTIVTKKMNIWQNSVERHDQDGTIKSIAIFDAKYLAKGKGNLDDKFKVATYDYVLNSILSNSDLFTLLAGDPAIFGQSKNWKGQEAIVGDIKDDSFFIKQAKKQGVNTGKRLALLIAPGATLADSQGKTYKQIFLADSPQMSENVDYLISLYYGKEALNESLMGKITVKEALATFKITKDDTQKKVIKNALMNKFEKIGSYFDLASTDAQEYSTVKEHVDILLNQGRLSQEEYDTINTRLALKQDLTKELLNLVLQPIKPVYTGQILDLEQDLARTVYIKSSSFPLLPQLTAGLKLDGLRVAMEDLEAKHGVPVRASYQSANKVGALLNSLTIDPLDPNSLVNIENAMLTLDRNNFRIQQDVPFKSDKKKKDEIAMGTQIFKLLFGDGMLTLDGFKLNPEDANTISGAKLYELYKDTIFRLIDIKTQELYKELGLSIDGKVTDPEVSTKKLQDLLQKEAIKRDYPIKDIKGLEIEPLKDRNGNTYYEFKVPLWLSSNSNRYESLLNAIVTNRILKHKIPGNSFVVGSENGFAFQDNLEGIDKSRIIYMDGFTGTELRGASEGSKAQILVPSKFKGADGKLIDLFSKNETDEFIYLEKRENGSWRLKDGMIDPELMSTFTFRTPTSAHVSASTVEIVGFLPSESGDLMVVPKNFTAQKGLDYDVDKENAYQYNHLVNYKTKKIEILTEKHKEKGLKKLGEILDLIDLEREKIKRAPLAEEILSMIEISDNTGAEQIGNQIDATALEILTNEFTSKQEKYDALSNEYDIKLLENQFIRIHNAVFSNSAPEVQSKINKVLSMDYARSQANTIEEWTEKGAKYDSSVQVMMEADLTKAEASLVVDSSDNDFTILSDEYQKEKMGLGAAGKMAIGVYSNYVTFHSLIQQAEGTVRLKEHEGEDLVNKAITIGNITSTGILGLQNSLVAPGFKGEVRSIAEAFAERQNTATDNEKEQILGRVNITSETIGVDSLLVSLGFDKDSNGNSISYTLLSQPVLKQYIKALQDARGVTADYQKDLKVKVINQLLQNYGNGAYSYTENEGVVLNPDHILAENYNKKNLDSLLSADNLEQGISTSGADGLVQVAALTKFLELDIYAKKIGKTQGLLNTKSLGKSIIESNSSYEKLETLADEDMIENMTALFGDFQKIEDTPIRPEGYKVIGNYYVKATTPQGKIVITGLTVGQELWSKYFPYNDPYIKTIMGAILKESNVDVSSAFKVVEMQQEIIEEVKKFIFSWKGLGVFTDTASAERATLFMETATNTSLAGYLNSNMRDPALTGNKLLNTFTYEVETNGLPSLVKYNNTVSNNLDEKYLYNSLAELIIDNKPLPPRNGKPYSTRQLAQDLITYTYVEGGIQEAIQFIKYVPVEYLSEIGIQQGNEFVTANTIIQRVSNLRDPLVFKTLLGVSETTPMNSVFIKQYYQHNPAKATKYPKEISVTVHANGTLTFNTGLDPLQAAKFVTVKQKTKSKLKQDKFFLYEHTGGGIYKRIDVLGIHGMNEYELGNTDAKSLLAKEVIPTPVVTDPTKLSNVANLDLTNVKSGKSIREITHSIANNKDPKLAKLKIVAQTLLPMIDDKTKVIVGSLPRLLNKTASGSYDATNNILYVETTVREKESVFIHELIHSISRRELSKYYSQDANGFYTMLRDDAPQHVQDLNNVWKAFMKSVPDTIIQSAINKTLDMKAGKQTSWSIEERELGYAAVDIFEFLSVGLESDFFQKKMSAIQFSETQTLKERFMEVITKILQTINPNITKGSVAEASINEILNFIATEQQINAETAIFAKIEPDLFNIDDNARNAALEQMYAEDLARLGAIDEEVSGPADESLSPGIVDPFNQKC